MSDEHTRYGSLSRQCGGQAVPLAEDEFLTAPYAADAADLKAVKMAAPKS